MSPTSYQTAPPREAIIADGGWFVKRAADALTGISCGRLARSLPLTGGHGFFPDGLADPRD